MQVYTPPCILFFSFFFFFNDTATTEIYTLSLHDALPISPGRARDGGVDPGPQGGRGRARGGGIAAALPGRPARGSNVTMIADWRMRIAERTHACRIRNPESAIRHWLLLALAACSSPDGPRVTVTI